MTIAEILRQNANVIHASYDSAWLRDPLPVLLESQQLETYDLVLGSDVGGPTDALFFVRGTPGNADLFERMANALLDTESGETMTDSASIVEVLGNRHQDTHMCPTDAHQVAG